MASCADASILVTGYGTSAAAVIHVWDTSVGAQGALGSPAVGDSKPGDPGTDGAASEAAAAGEADEGPPLIRDSGSKNTATSGSSAHEGGSINAAGKLEGHTGYVRTMALSADGQTIVTGSDDGSVSVGSSARGNDGVEGYVK
jgi:WD40 repeat protein